MRRYLTYITSALLTSLLLACSSSDEDILPPISQQDFLEVSKDKVYTSWTDGTAYTQTVFYLKNKHGKWEETTPVTKSGGGDLDSALGHIYCPIKYPSYIWVKNNDVYTTYSGTMNIMSEWISYSYTQGDGKGADEYSNHIWLSVANSLQMTSSNAMLLSSAYYKGIQDDGYKFVLEEASDTRLVIRIEYKEPYLKCDGIRLIYTTSGRLPKYFRDFQTEEEAEAYVKAVIDDMSDDTDKGE